MKLTLRHDKLRWLLRGALAAKSSDNVTPVLTGVFWESDDKWVTLTATDRYRVHQLRMPRPKGMSKGAFLMSGEQAKWIARTTHRGLSSPEAQVTTIEWAKRRRDDAREQYDITATVAEFDSASAAAFTYKAASIDGNFPPVARLFPDMTKASPDEALADHFGIDPRSLGDLKTMQTHPSMPLVFWTPRGSEQVRFNPILAANNQGAGWTARALIQPNILTGDVLTEEQALERENP